MGRYPIGLTIILMLGVTTICFAGGNSEDNLPRAEKKPPVTFAQPIAKETRIMDFSGRPDWIYEASDWILNLYIMHKGSRSQGSHGILLFEGNEVDGTPGEVKALPIGTVEYHGPAETRQHLRDNSGWQMADPLVKPIVHTPADARIKGQAGNETPEDQTFQPE